MAGVTQTAFEAVYIYNPILLTGGLAGDTGIPIPIGTILSAVTGGLFTSDKQAIKFQVLPGATLVEAVPVTYPTLTQQVASNATLINPLHVAVGMFFPAQGLGGVAIKTAALNAMSVAIQAHVQAGGLFTIMTPARPYMGCVLTSLSDASTGESKQLQWDWTWQFEQPITGNDIVANLSNTVAQAATSGMQTIQQAGASILNTVTNNVTRILG